MPDIKVYQAITNVTKAIGQEGIAKDKKNAQQGYNFRGIDDCLNALSPILSANGLCILPCVLDRQCEERQSANGKSLFYVTVKVRFDFVSAEDGSKHEIVMYGEAMDSADKATNKAQSAAYKYAVIQAFCIPTEGDNDADMTTHEVKPKPPKQVAKVDSISCLLPEEMDNAFLSMLEATTMDDLKKVFARFYTAANNEQKDVLKTEYEKSKSILEKK